MESAQLSPEGFRKALEMVMNEWLDVERFEIALRALNEIDIKSMRGQGPQEAERAFSVINDRTYNQKRMELHTKIGEACKKILEQTDSDESTRNRVIRILNQYISAPTFFQKVFQGKKSIPEDMETASGEFLAVVNLVKQDLPEYFALKNRGSESHSS